MTELAFACVLALAWFGAVNAVLSAVAAAMARALDRGRSEHACAASPAALLALKLLPGGLSLVFTIGLFLPAHWRFEPAGAEESAGYCLTVIAAIGVVPLALAARRAWRDARLTGRLERRWVRRAGAPRMLAGRRLPVYVLPNAAPALSLGGLWRPRVFVAASVVSALTPEELDVSLAHELAHHDARDNLKRVLVAATPDFLAVWRPGRRLERQWRAAIEFAADDRAVRGDEGRAATLASALLKVARLTAPPPAAFVGVAFHDTELLKARVDRLLGLSSGLPRAAGAGSGWPVPVGVIATLAALLVAPGAWFGVHLATEGLVRFLP